MIGEPLLELLVPNAMREVGKEGGLRADLLGDLDRVLDHEMGRVSLSEPERIEDEHTHAAQ